MARAASRSFVTARGRRGMGGPPCGAEGVRNSSGGLGGVETPLQRSGRSSQRAGRGCYGLPEVWDAFSEVCEGSGGPHKGLEGVGRNP